MYHGKCLKCGSEFDAAGPMGYCGPCRQHFLTVRDSGRRLQRPARGVLLDPSAGTLTKDLAADCPRTVPDPNPVGPEYDLGLCGVCGSAEVSSEYGHCYFGLGVFVRCWNPSCRLILDFQPDSDDE